MAERAKRERWPKGPKQMAERAEREVHLLTATNSMRKVKAAWQLAWVGSMAANGKTAAHLAALWPFVGSFWKS